MIEINKVLESLKGVKKAGNNQWLACCPAHDDKHPSLKVTEETDGRILFHCYAGCDFNNIRESLQLTVADLTPSNSIVIPSPVAPKEAPIDVGSLWLKCMVKREHYLGQHPYLLKKKIEHRNFQVTLENLRKIIGYYPQSWNGQLTGVILVVPIYNINNDIISLEFIDGDGKKSALGRTSKKSGFYPVYLRENPNVVAYSEGVATAITVDTALATNDANLLSLATLSITNLYQVVKEHKAKYPTARHIIAAELDKKTGLPIAEAIRVAKEFGCDLAVPKFSGERAENATDFNDLYITEGIEVVKNCLRQAAPVAVKEVHEEKEVIVPSILDTPVEYAQLNLLQHISDNSLISQLSKALHKATLIPESTIFAVGLGTFSSVATRAYAVDYEHSGSLPISLYVCAEQPSGAAKTRVMNTFTTPFNIAHEKARDAYQDQILGLKRLKLGEEDKVTKAELGEAIDELTKQGAPLLFVNNATVEALENSLYGTGGFFSCVSSEQGLFNTIFSLTYSHEKSTPNRDIILHGYDNGFYGGLRISRNAFYGQVTGGVTLFAQNGSIQTVLNTSEGSGLAERFLLIAEPHSLGIRNHFNENFVPNSLKDQYDDICANIANNIEYPVNRKKLAHLSITPKGWWLIKSYRNKIETELADGKRFSHGALRGIAAKIDMTIMKLAANLHLLEGNREKEIADSTVQSAISIANDLLESAVNIMDVKQITGQSAACAAIVETLTNKSRPLTEREIIQTVHNRQPFKSHTGNKSDFIRITLQQLVSENTIIITQEKARKSYSMS